jgi:hypothetical protein
VDPRLRSEATTADDIIDGEADLTTSVPTELGHRYQPTLSTVVSSKHGI